MPPLKVEAPPALKAELAYGEPDGLKGEIPPFSALLPKPCCELKELGSCVDCDW